MLDRLPPEVAALLPNGDQLDVADLTLHDVRLILRGITAIVRSARCELTQLRARVDALAVAPPATCDNPTPPAEGAVVEGPQG